MMFKKLFCLVLALIFVSSISVCVFSQEKEVELVLWCGSWKEDFTIPVINEFEEKNPGIKVRVEYWPWDGMIDKFLIALKNDNGPDVINLAVDWTITFEAMGKLAPLDEFIAADKMDMSDFFEGALQTARYNGKTYALPYRSEAMGIFFNKKIFKEAGLNPDKAPETWPQLLEYAKATTKGDVFGWGLLGRDPENLFSQLIVMIWSNGGEILNDDYTKCTLNEPAAVEAAQFYVDLYRKYKVTPLSTMENNEEENVNLFTNEKVAMVMSGNYSIEKILKANPNIQMGTAVPPKWKTIKLRLAGWNTAITNTCKNKEAAWKLIKFLSSTEISPRYSHTFPGRKSAAKNEKYYKDPYQKAFLDLLNYSYPMPQVPQMSQIKQIVYDQMQYALVGEKTGEQAMNDAVKEIDPLLK